MAYNVRQLQELQDKISMKPDVPNAMDRYTAMKLLQRKPVRRPMRRDHGGELQDNANELASKGRHGDTMLMHVTPEEVRGLSSIAPVTINPETGLPEAFAWLPMVLAGAAIGGIGSAATGGDPIKGALLGAVGGFMPTALGGLAGATGLGSLWTRLGPIGQGMLSGAAMGGVRSLFGDSDNPLRDILIGGAMGGVGGAMFPGTVEASGLEGMEYGKSIRDGVTDMIPSVPDYTSGVPSVIPPSSTYQAARGSLPIGATQTSSQLVQPPNLQYGYSGVRPVAPQAAYNQGMTRTVAQSPADIYGQRSDILSGGEEAYGGGSAGPDRFQSQLQSPVRDFGWEGYRTGPTNTSSSDPTFGYDPSVAESSSGFSPEERSLWTPEASFGTKIKDWWGERKPWEQAAMIGGTGLLGLSTLEEQQPQAALAQARPPSAIPFLPAKPFRVPISRGDEEETAEEFYVRTIGEGRTPEEAEYFTEEDVNVAKEGGIVSLYGGGPSRHPAAGQGTIIHPGTPTYAMGLTNRPDAMQRTTGSMGDPRYRTPMSLTEWNANFGPEASGSNGGGAPSPIIKQPFEFPEVTPFQTNLPRYSIEEDIIENVSPTPIATPAPVSSIPVSSLSPTGLGTLQQIALANAASVAEQALSPTATVAAPVPTTSVNPEEQAIIDQFTGQEGGIIGLANGGNIPQFGTNTPVFEGRVQGFGDGMADQVSFGVVPQTPEDIPNTPDVALLSSDEYVIPADVVSMLGNGSSTAGSQALDRFNKIMRMKAHGTNKKQRELDAGRELSSLV